MAVATSSFKIALHLKGLTLDDSSKRQYPVYWRLSKHLLLRLAPLRGSSRRETGAKKCKGAAFDMLA